MSYFPKTSVYMDVDSASVDAFGRLRISEPITIFDNQFSYDLQPLIWQQITTGSATITHLPNLSAVRLTTTGTGYAIMQTYEYFKYQPLKSQAFAISSIFGSGTTNTIKRIGYFDDNDGIFFEQTNSDIAFVRRTSTSGSPVDNRIVQSSWNLDTLDGSGGINNPSGIRLDLTKSELLMGDLQWLAVGRVRTGFSINGETIYCHQLNNANNLDVPYIKTANLPLRFEIRNTGSGLVNNLTCICCAVLSEGGVETERHYSFGVSNPSNITVSTTRTPLLAIRPRTTFNGLTNRIKSIIKDISVLGGSQAVAIEIIYGATLTGGSWNNIDTNSSVEYNVTVASYTGGTLVDTFPVPSNSGGSSRNYASKDLSTHFPLVTDAFGNNPKNILIVAYSTTLTSDCRAYIRLDEVR